MERGFIFLLDGRTQKQFMECKIEVVRASNIYKQTGDIESLLFS